MPFDFSLVTAPFRMQPGLRRVAPGTRQLTPSEPGGRHLREKMAVLARFAPQALLVAPGFDPQRALSAIGAEASTLPAPAFAFHANGDCGAPRLGWSVRGGQPQGRGDAAIGDLLASLPPMQRAAALASLAFEEDFAVIDGARATIPWLAVCLPSRWAPEEKIGRHFAEVHAPVADNAVLLAASEQLALLVTGTERWERFVWTIRADPRLHQHPARGEFAWPEAADAGAIGALAHFRHEHQTFIPMPGGGQAVFTIRVGSEPLRQALLSREDALRVHAAVASMTPAVLAYRGLASVRDRLLAWLADRAEALPAARP